MYLIVLKLASQGPETKLKYTICGLQIKQNYI